MKEAFFHISHGSVGKSTHRARTASAYLKYIGRSGSVWLTNTGQDSKQAARFLDRQEMLLRKNARVVDRVIFGLPRGFTLEQCQEISVAFAKRICEPGNGVEADWWLAIHLHAWDTNPHAHLCFSDRCRKTGKPVWKTSERGSTERLRMAWEEVLNEHLAAAGHMARAYRQSYKKRGFDREPTIHEGPGLRAMLAAGKPLPPNNRIAQNLAIKAERIANTPLRGRAVARKVVRLLDRMLDVER